jgi:hypothetical protein
MQAVGAAVLREPYVRWQDALGHCVECHLLMCTTAQNELNFAADADLMALRLLECTFDNAATGTAGS